MRNTLQKMKIKKDDLKQLSSLCLPASRSKTFLSARLSRLSGSLALSPIMTQSPRERGKELIFFFVLLLLVFFHVSVSYSAPKTSTDEVGRVVTIPFPPKRIVSLAPNITEILFSLGLDEQIMGVSIHCNFPEKAKTKVQVGSYISLDFERVVSLKPDLIIATGAGNTRDMVERLQKLGFAT